MNDLEDLGKEKALDQDGFTVTFYVASWEDKTEVMSFFKGFFERNGLKRQKH